MKAKLTELGLPVRAEGPAALARLVQSDREMYGRIIRDHPVAAPRRAAEDLEALPANEDAVADAIADSMEVAA